MLTASLALAEPPAADKAAKPADKAAKPPAAKPGPPTPPEVKKTVDAWVGTWSCDATVALPGAAKPAQGKLRMDCKKAAGGRGVACTGTGKIPEMGPWDASILIAHDAIGGRTHFMAITSDGEVHDHACTWKTDMSMVCDPLKFGPNTEDLTVTWEDAKSQTFKSITKMADGTVSFEGHCKRPTAPK